MKRRFEETLLAVAIAALGVAASAIAPTISNIKSPVIGTGGVTESNAFVYPDALDVDVLARDTDQTVPDEDIIWSYTGLTDRYMINGVEQMVVGTDNPVSPAGKQLDTQDLDDQQVDNDPNTLTFRDATIDPIGAPLNLTGVVPGITAQDMVTLFASDGTTYSQKSFYVYTDNGGEDRLSGVVAEEVLSIDFTSPANFADWTTAHFIPGAFEGTFSTSGGMCVDAGDPADDAYSGWVSPSGIFDLAANSVYRIRVTVEGEGQAAGTTPLWTFVVDNNNNAGTGDNKWAAEWFCLDNENGANAPQTTGRTDFVMYWNPLAVNEADWNDPTTGMFTPARVDGGNNAGRFIYRILDVDGAVPGGSLDYGQICMTDLVMDRIDIADMTVASNLFDSTLDASGFTHNSIVGSTTGTFAGGALTLTPTDGSWELEVDEVDTGDTTLDLTNPSTVVDNFPLAWNSDEIIMTTISCTAPNATGESNPPDVIRIQNDTPTNELLMYNLLVSTSNTLGMPKVGETAEYVSFYFTHTQTASSTTGLDRIRSRFVVISTEAINSGGVTQNAGGITISNFKMDLVEDPTL